MTSEDYARVFSNRLLSAARRYDVDRETRWYARAFSMGVQRIMFTGADEYEIAHDVQAVEVKPLGELIADMEEEAVDLMAYAAMFAEREPQSSNAAEHLIALAAQQMRVLDELRGE